MFKRIIITADDYGMCRSVNLAINAGIEAGLIKSTNVMSNMPDYEEAKKLRENYTGLSVGIHWNLTAGIPISSPDKISSLVNDEGEFYSFTEFRKRYRKGKIVEKEMLIELHEQFTAFFNVCGQPDYWNTHQNIHVDFQLFHFFLKLASDLSITKMRTHRRIYVPASDGIKLPPKRRLLEPFKQLLLTFWMTEARKLGQNAPEGLIVCLNESKDKNNLEYVLENIQWKNNSIAELVIHPATDTNCKYFGSVTEQRLHEYKLYRNEKVLQIFEKHNIKTINFQEF